MKLLVLIGCMVFLRDQMFLGDVLGLSQRLTFFFCSKPEELQADTFSKNKIQTHQSNLSRITATRTPIPRTCLTLVLTVKDLIH